RRRHAIREEGLHPLLQGRAGLRGRAHRGDHRADLRLRRGAHAGPPAEHHHRPRAADVRLGGVHRGGRLAAAGGLPARRDPAEDVPAEAAEAPLLRLLGGGDPRARADRLPRGAAGDEQCGATFPDPGDQLRLGDHQRARRLCADDRDDRAEDDQAPARLRDRPRPERGDLMLAAAIVFFILLALGMPVAFTIAIAGLAFFMVNPNLPMSIMAQNVVSPSQSYTLLAIPLFIFAGNLMNATGITKRLIDLSNVLTGHMYGSLGQVSAVLSTMMGGISGSANADAAMESRILGPAMVKRGYSRGYAAAVNGVTALITATIPPSMGLIIYGSVGQVSIGRLFAAGFVPGVLMMIALMITVRITAKRREYLPETTQRATLKEVGNAAVSGAWALGFPILLIAGIRFGIFTPSESGAFACGYAVFVGAVVYRELTWTRFLETLKSTARDIGIIMILVAMSGAIGYGIVYDQVPQSMSEFLVGVTDNQFLMILIAIAMLMVCGMFIETTVIALLMTPILVPVVTQLGIDPVHFGLIMMTATTLGIMTPPVGIALYTTSQILETTPERTARAALPFFGATVVVLLVIAAFPDLVLWVPNLVFGT